MKKRRHHFVWQYYLKPWAVDGRIACWRNGQVFRTDPINVAVERDFYRLRDISERDVATIRQMIHLFPSQLRDVHNTWLEMFTLPFELRRMLNATGQSDRAIEEALDRAFLRDRGTASRGDRRTQAARFAERHGATGSGCAGVLGWRTRCGAVPSRRSHARRTGPPHLERHGSERRAEMRGCDGMAVYQPPATPHAAPSSRERSKGAYGHARWGGAVQQTRRNRVRRRPPPIELRRGVLQCGARVRFTVVDLRVTR